MSNSSKRRLVITAVLAGSSQSEVARTYGVSQGWISRLMKRYAAEGEAAFEPRSRAPRTSPTATAAATIDLVLELRKKLSEAGLDAGADTLEWHLQHHHQIKLARATINRILVRAGAVTPDPCARRDHGAGLHAGLPAGRNWGTQEARTNRNVDHQREVRLPRICEGAV